MTKRGRLRDELRRLGSSPVPVLDPARAQRLERRVFDAARPRELELVDTDSIDPRRTSRRRSVVVALAAACLLAVVVIGSLDRAGSSEWILFTSGDVDVELPDGSVVAGSDGMTVPDGAILRLGRNGEAEVDGITVSGAGDYLVTRDGLRLLATSKPSASSPPTTGPDDPSTIAAGAPVVGAAPGSTEPAPAITVVRPTTTERVPATTLVRPTTTTASDSATTIAPPPTTSQRVAPPPPVSSPEPRPTEPPSTTTSTVPTTTPPTTVAEPSSDGPAPLDVTIRSDERGVVFAWRAVVGANGYVVAALPAASDGAGSWPPAPGAEITELHAGTLQFRVARPTDGAWSYRIAAVARDGRTLAVSRVFTIES